jgi:hypothetical protein
MRPVYRLRTGRPGEATARSRLRERDAGDPQPAEQQPGGDLLAQRRRADITATPARVDVDDRAGGVQWLSAAVHAT